MKDKRHTTEDSFASCAKLTEAKRGENVPDPQISEVSLHRWKRQFDQMDLHDARKLKELERENSELKNDACRSPAQQSCVKGRRRKKR